MKKILAQIKASMGIYESEPVYGLLAEFADPGALLYAASQVLSLIHISEPTRPY